MSVRLTFGVDLMIRVYLRYKTRQILEPFMR